MASKLNPTIIRVTSVGSCQRPLYYRQKGELPLPNHFYSTKGTIAHTLIEHELEGDVGDISYIAEDKMDELSVPDYGREELRNYAAKLHKNFHIWKATTDLIKPYEKIVIEERLTREVVPGFLLSGKPDLITDRYIIDFKSGARSSRKNYRQQLGAYRWLTGDEAEGDSVKRSLVNVFLGVDVNKNGNGHGKYRRGKSGALTAQDMEVIHKEDQVSRDMIYFWDDFNHTVDDIKTIQAGKMPKCRRSFLCAFCEYNHVCRGYGGVDA